MLSLPEILLIGTPVLALITLVYCFLEIQKKNREVAKERQEISHRIYETLILREIGERIGYELNIEKILETIIASLNRLVPYSVASYLLLSPDPEKVLYRAHLDESVGHTFLSQVQDYLLTTLNQTFEKNYSLNSLVERASGTIIDDTDTKRALSLWITPLKINSRGIGVLALASSKPGMFKGPEMEVLIKILAQANRAVNQLEEVLNNEQSKIYSMISSIPDGILMMDLNDNLIGINNPAINLLGLDRHKTISILDIVQSLAGKMDLRAKITEALQSNILIKVDNLVVGDNIMCAYISPARNKEQKLIGSVVVLHEATTEKQLERLREDFTAMMVHELRAPLTLIKGTTDMFLTQPEITTGAQGRELLETMKTSSSTMLDLVNDLLDAAKIEAGKFQIAKFPDDLRPIIRQTIMAFNQQAAEKQISLEYKDAGLPLKAEFDHNRLLQVLNNFLSNAIKFTSTGGKVVIEAKKLESWQDFSPRFDKTDPSSFSVINVKFPCFIVSINDNGMGIPIAQINDLFSKFKQLGKNTSAHRGTGLGLVITKGIVESHGGSIFVESEVNTGTTFHFTIPVTAPS